MRGNMLFSDQKQNCIEEKGSFSQRRNPLHSTSVFVRPRQEDFIMRHMRILSVVAAGLIVSLSAQFSITAYGARAMGRSAFTVSDTFEVGYGCMHLYVSRDGDNGWAWQGGSGHPYPAWPLNFSATSPDWFFCANTFLDFCSIELGCNLGGSATGYVSNGMDIEDMCAELYMNSVDDVIATGYANVIQHTITAQASGTVSLNMDYEYEVDLTGASSGYVTFAVAFWKGAPWDDNLLLAPGSGWVATIQDIAEVFPEICPNLDRTQWSVLEKTVYVASGQSTGVVSVSKNWNINVTEGMEYSCLMHVEVNTSAPEPTGITIRGTVLDAVTMQPLAGAEVTANGEPTPPFTTEADGKYEISGLPDGPITVTASKDGYISEEQELPYSIASVSDWYDSPYYCCCEYAEFGGFGGLCDDDDPDRQDFRLFLVPEEVEVHDCQFRPARDGFHFKNKGSDTGDGAYCSGMSLKAFNLWLNDELPNPKIHDTDTDGWPLEPDDQVIDIRTLQKDNLLVILNLLVWPWETYLDIEGLCGNFDQGRPQALVLAKWLGKKLYGAHMVVAYKVLKQHKKCFIWIYDSNYPEQERRMTLIKEGENWKMPVIGFDGYTVAKAVPYNTSWLPPFEVVAYSPVVLNVTDPDGFVLSENLNEIEWGCYQKLDFNGDSDEDEVVTIVWPKEGLYSVEVIPNPDAIPTETYSLGVTFGGETVTLAEDVSISDISDKPYVIQCTESGINVVPIADAGENQTVEGISPDGAEVTLYGAGSSDPDGDDLTYTWTEGGEEIATGPTPTVPLSLDTHTITLTVDDGNGGTDCDEVVIEVVDTTKPDIALGEPVPSVLWPANHKFVEVVILGITGDICDDALDIDVSVEVIDAEGGDGGPTHEPDFKILAVGIEGDEISLLVAFRAERSGQGDGRIYQITVDVRDDAGNTATETVEVTVPHDQGKGKKK